jgi:protein phosphatase
VGDSRIYHLDQDDSFKQLTVDHTHIGWLKEKGKISDYEARNDPRRNILQQVIGGKTQHLSPQFGELIFDAKDRLLICSDGLNEGLMDSALKRMLKFDTPIYKDESNVIAQRMVDESVREDGKDNTTALCFEVLDLG